MIAAMLVAATVPAIADLTSGANPLASTILFMDKEHDAFESYGLIYSVATPLTLDGDTTLELSRDTALLAAFDPNPQRPKAGYEIFFSNRTSAAADALSYVYFATTTSDFTGLASTPVPVACIGIVNGSKETPPLHCYPKSVGRSDDGTSYIMMMFCESGSVRTSEGIRSLHSADPRVPLSFTGRDEVAYHDHDDQQLIYDAPRSRWAVSQITFQNYTTPGFRPPNVTGQSKKYCDNAGCLFRRVVSTRVSADDGLSWSNSSACNETWHGDPVRGQENFCTAPGGWNKSGILAGSVDPNIDPPELEFYKLTMFKVQGRLVGHALLYSPAPMAKLGFHYGMMNNESVACGGTAAGLKNCHGPHMYTERFLGPPSAGGDPTDLQAWSRPFRRVRIAPRDQMLSVGPITLQDGRLAWPSSTDTAAPDSGIPLYSVPENRVAGLYAPANGEFSTAAFPWPLNGILTLNFDAHWEQQEGGSCDEKCQAYVMISVLDVDAGNTIIPGYAEENCVLVNMNSTKHNLEWKAPITPPPSPAQNLSPAPDSDSDPAVSPPPLISGGTSTAIPAGKLVRLRFYFRDATLYALTF